MPATRLDDLQARSARELVHPAAVTLQGTIDRGHFSDASTVTVSLPNDAEFFQREVRLDPNQRTFTLSGLPSGKLTIALQGKPVAVGNSGGFTVSNVASRTADTKPGETITVDFTKSDRTKK